jgi:hypothetical protein
VIGVGAAALVVGTLTALTGALIGGIVGSKGFYEPAPDWVPKLRATAAHDSGAAAASWSF